MVDAVECAVAIQRGMNERNASVPEDRQIVFRIGINLGDVIIDDDDIYGDGVNVAARLESLADPAGICISGSAWEQVLDKVAEGFSDLGEQQLKNITRPVRVWHWTAEGGAVGLSRTGQIRSDKPSIAVLPFDNMSGDPEQDLFADGMVDEIITELSRFPDLFVIARNSTFTYKGRAVKVQDVARELGVAYVLEGGVRKAGKRVRITVQLIDAKNGNHIWAERYDRELADIFELQDELTQTIVGVLPGRVEFAAAAQIKRKPLNDMAAYDYLLAGKIHHDRVTRDDNIEALRLLNKAIELEPDYAAAWAWKACTLGQALDNGYMDNPGKVLEEATKSLHKALALDEYEVNCHRLLCELSMEEGHHDEAQLHHDKAYKLNPNNVLIVAQRGELLFWKGMHDEGARWVEKAMQLDPFAAHRRAHLLGRARHAARHYQAALDAFRQIRSPRVPFIADMAACYARIGDATAADARVAEVLRSKPNFSTAAYVEKLPYLKPEDRIHHHEGLILAGLPE